MPYYGNSSLSSPVSARQYVELIERVASIGTWAWEASSGVMVWSTNLHRLMRTDPARHRPSMDDVIAMTHPDDRWIVQEKIRPDGDLDVATPARIVFADGTHRWQIFHKERVGVEGEIMIGVVQDITEAWNAQNVAAQRQRLVDTILRLVGGILWRANSDGTLVFDTGWTEFTGTTLADNSGTGWLKSIHPDDRLNALRAWENAMVAKGIYSTAYRVRRYDGIYCRMIAKAAPHTDANGKVIEWVGCCAPAQQANAEPVRGGQTTATLTGKELRVVRSLLNMTVKDLAGLSGVSASTISRHEMDDQIKSIRPGKLVRLERVLSDHGIEFSERKNGRRSLSYMDGSSRLKTLD